VADVSQDQGLACEARGWQSQVSHAYAQYIATEAFTAACRGARVSLQEFMWAVGCVESRAYGVRVGGWVRGVAYVSIALSTE
jgi:hypothetical protein